MANAEVEQMRVEQLAYWFWQQRGRPVGTPEEDWRRAEQQLRLESHRTWLPLYAMAIERKTV